MSKRDESVEQFIYEYCFTPLQARALRERDAAQREHLHGLLRSSRQWLRQINKLGAAQLVSKIDAALKEVHE